MAWTVKTWRVEEDARERARALKKEAERAARRRERASRRAVNDAHASLDALEQLGLELKASVAEQREQRVSIRSERFVRDPTLTDDGEPSAEEPTVRRGGRRASLHNSVLAGLFQPTDETGLIASPVSAASTE